MLNPEEHANLDYQALAELRYQIRCFLRFSEQAARTAGLEPQQHQLLLALKGLPRGKKATVGALAERLQIQHHSTGELVDRLAARKLIRRYRSRVDRRQVFVRLTTNGERILRDLSLYHLQELQSVGPSVVKILNELISNIHPSRAAQPWSERAQEDNHAAEQKEKAKNGSR